MSSQHTTIDHARADELIEDFVFGALSAEEHAWMTAHVAECDICGPEVESLRIALDHLPFAAPEPAAELGADVWSRIEQRIAPAAAPAPVSLDAERARRRSLPMSMQSIAAIAVVALLVGLLAGLIVPEMLDDGDQVVSYQVTSSAADFQPELEYHNDTGVLLVSNVPAAQSGQVYQAWLIVGDDAPIPVGVIDAATGTLAIAADPDAYDVFAITLEPGPIGSGTPTTDPIAVAELP